MSTELMLLNDLDVVPTKKTWKTAGRKIFTIYERFDKLIAGEELRLNLIWISMREVRLDYVKG
jgi:hypothetical protein